MSNDTRRPTEEECWAGFWQVVGKAAAHRYLRELEEQQDDAEVISFPLAA